MKFFKVAKKFKVAKNEILKGAKNASKNVFFAF